jgi:hypothetical protein
LGLLASSECSVAGLSKTLVVRSQVVSQKTPRHWFVLFQRSSSSLSPDFLQDGIEDGVVFLEFGTDEWVEIVASEPSFSPLREILLVIRYAAIHYWVIQLHLFATPEENTAINNSSRQSSFFIREYPSGNYRPVRGF